MNTFFSLLLSTCFTKAHPEPIRTIVKKRSPPYKCVYVILYTSHGFDHLQKMSDIVQDCPRLFVYTIGSNLGVVDLNITD